MMLTETPTGLTQIIKIFGSLTEAGFEENHIVPFSFPYPLYYEGTEVHRGRCHKLIADNFKQAFNHILSAGLQDEVKNYSGIYAKRNIRGASHPSTHSWGIAIDLEAAKYPLGSNKRFPQTIVDIFKAAGFYYGGDFTGRRDPMHFQWAKGY